MKTMWRVQDHCIVPVRVVKETAKFVLVLLREGTTERILKATAVYTIHESWEVAHSRLLADCHDRYRRARQAVASEN